MILTNLFFILVMLQLKTYKVKLEKKPCINPDTTKLDSASRTKCLSYIYLANSLYYIKSSLS